MNKKERNGRRLQDEFQLLVCRKNFKISDIIQISFFIFKF